MANDYSNKYVDGNGLSHFWSLIKQRFVAKETGKGLSTNDYTDEEKTKLAGIATGANKYTRKYRQVLKSKWSVDRLRL